MTATTDAAAFTPFPKIQRINRDMVVTEKIDGTNAAVVVTENGYVFAQSRTRVITPGDDNFGFAAWVADHADDLRYGLGEGVHFGEWWGRGIQRGYGLEERRFSLFNTGRWTSPYNNCGFGTGPVPDDVTDEWHLCEEVPVCHVVPVLRVSTFNTGIVETEYALLRRNGSVAARGFANPEGVVVYHTGGGNTLFKLNDAKVAPSERG